MGASRRRWFNQSTHLRVANSTASRLRHGPRGRIRSQGEHLHLSRRQGAPPELAPVPDHQVRAEGHQHPQVRRAESGLRSLPLARTKLLEGRAAPDPALGARGRASDSAEHRQDRRIRRFHQASKEGRDALRPLEAHPRPWTATIARAMRRQRRTRPRCHCPEPQKARKVLPHAATAKARVRRLGAPVLQDAIRINATTALSHFFNKLSPDPKLRVGREWLLLLCVVENGRLAASLGCLLGPRYRCA